jgi:hypothetical protein
MIPPIEAPILLHDQPDVDALAAGTLLGPGHGLYALGPRPPEVARLAADYGIELSGDLPTRAFLVDHAFRTDVAVVGALDHHPLPTLPSYPLLWAPVGAAATLAWLATRDRPRAEAHRRLALLAIVADTLLFRSPRTTALDEALARELGDVDAAAGWLFRLEESPEELRQSRAKRIAGVEVVSVDFLGWDPRLDALAAICRRDGAVLLLNDVALGRTTLVHDHPTLAQRFPTDAQGRHVAGRILSRSLDIGPLLRTPTAAEASGEAQDPR